MMGRFWITGLPRSRTAWLSIAATTGNSICHHEPGYGDYETAAALWRGLGKYPSVGIADAGMGMIIDRILWDFSPKTLIIERPVSEVFDSFLAYNGEASPNLMDRLYALQSALAKADNALIKRISYDALTDEDVVRECLDWMGIKPLNLSGLMRLNIQADLAYQRAKVASLTALEEA